MSMMGEIYRISPSRLQELLADPAQIQAELYPDDYPANLTENGTTVEKTWDAIEFVLGRLARNGKIPWIEPLSGGNATGCVLHYGPVWYRAPNEVAKIANVLNSISRDDFREGFIPELMSEKHVYPDFWNEDSADALFDYVWQHYEDMVQFYRSAAYGGDAVLLHLG
jgi:hypothetical protein